MLDFRVVIAACIAGVAILLGGFGLVASFKIAHEPAAVRPANRIVERPRIEPNASRPFVIETPAVKPAPAREAVRAPEPAPAPALAPVPVVVPAPAPVAPPVEARAPAPPAAIEITGTIAPKPAPTIPAAIARAPAAADLPTTMPVEHPQATADLPSSGTAAKKTPRRPRPAAPAPGPTNPFSAIFGGFTNQ